MSQWNQGQKSYAAAEDLAKYRRVKLVTATTVGYSDSHEDYLGITKYAVKSGLDVAVWLRSNGGSVKVTAAGPFSLGDALYAADDGMVDDAVTHGPQFMALEAAGALNDIVEVMPVGGAAMFTESIGENSWDEVGLGMTVNAANQFGRITAVDDGGVALTATWYAASYDHLMISEDYDSALNVSAFGHIGELQLSADITPGGNYAGVWGSAGVDSGKTLTNPNNISFSGVMATLDVPSGATVGTGGLASALAIGGNLGGTHTGPCAAIHLTNPSAGAWDYLFQFGRTVVADSTGVSEVISGNTGNQTRGLKIRFCDTDWWIVCQSATS